MTELRRFLRISKEYRVEYGPFPLSGGDGELKTSRIQNIGGGGLMFQAPEPFPPGRQLLLKIHISGWRQDGEEIIESTDPETEAPVTAIAQVLRSDYNSDEGYYLIGVEFLGRILP